MKTGGQSQRETAVTRHGLFKVRAYPQRVDPMTKQPKHKRPIMPAHVRIRKQVQNSIASYPAVPRSLKDGDIVYVPLKPSGRIFPSL